MQDESYTSKASCLDQDPVLYYKEGETPPEFSGKRTRRGLYRSANGILINADVNGAANIIRNRYPDAFQRAAYGLSVSNDGNCKHTGLVSPIQGTQEFKETYLQQDIQDKTW